MTFNIYIVLGNILFTAVYDFFTCINLKGKINRVIIFLIMFIPSTIVMLLTLWYPDEFSLIGSYLPIVIQVAAALLLFKDSIKERILIPAVTLSVYLLLAVTIDHPLSTLLEEYEHTPMVLAFLVFISVLYSLILSMFTLFRKKEMYKEEYKSNISAFVFFPASQVVLAFCSVLAINSDVIFKNENAIAIFGRNENILLFILAIGVLIGIVGDIIIFKVMIQNTRAKRLQTELEMMNYQNELNLEYYQSLKQDATETRKIRHDLLNVIQTMYLVFHEDIMNDKDKSEKILLDLEEEITGVGVEEYSKNQLINVIVASKVKKCKENKIKTNIVINVEEELSVSDIDICRIYTNMFDNSIKATSFLAERERKIFIESYVTAGYLYIKFANTATQKDLAYEPGKNKKRRGYGLSILRDIAAKYNGSFIAEKNNDMFISLVSLKI